MVEEKQYSLALIDRNVAHEGAGLGLYYLARSPAQVQQGRKEHVEKDERLEADLAGQVCVRFPKF